MNDSNSISETKQAALSTLHERSSMEDAEHQVNDTIRQIIDAVNAISPSLQWQPHGDRMAGPCGGEFANTGGSRVNLTLRMISDVPIPDSDWPHVLQSARDIAGRSGMTKLEVMRDLPGNHDVRLSSDDGNAIEFGTWKAAVIEGETGCRLPAQR